MAPKPTNPLDAHFQAGLAKQKPHISPGRAALRERFAKARKKPGEMVTVDLGDGEPVTLEARRPTAGSKWEIQQRGFKQGRGVDGEPDSQMVPRQFWPALIVAVYYIPGTDERMWSDDDAGEIASYDPEVVDALVAPALKALGWSKDATESIEGNSEPAATDDSSLTLPA